MKDKEVPEDSLVKEDLLVWLDNRVREESLVKLVLKVPLENKGLRVLLDTRDQLV